MVDKMETLPQNNFNALKHGYVPLEDRRLVMGCWGGRGGNLRQIQTIGSTCGQWLWWKIYALSVLLALFNRYW